MKENDFFFVSEEIAFYNGNVREKQTIHSTFKKLVCAVFVLILLIRMMPLHFIFNVDNKLSFCAGRSSA